MRVIRKIGLSALLLIATVFVQKSSAVVENLQLLPDSSYAAAVDNWQGWSRYEVDDFDLLIDYVVYDADIIEAGRPVDPPDSGLLEEWDFVDELVTGLDLTGRYIYVYQVFQRPDAEPGSAEDVGYFGLLDSDNNPIHRPDADVNSYTDFDLLSLDEVEGDKPDEWDNTPVGWTWYESDPLAVGEHSWLLICNSDFEPVAGDFEIRPPTEDGDGAPIPPIPEPATSALLGIGGVISVIFSRRRRSVG